MSSFQSNSREPLPANCVPPEKWHQTVSWSDDLAKHRQWYTKHRDLCEWVRFQWCGDFRYGRPWEIGPFGIAEYRPKRSFWYDYVADGNQALVPFKALPEDEDEVWKVMAWSLVRPRQLKAGGESTVEDLVLEAITAAYSGYSTAPISEKDLRMAFRSMIATCVRGIISEGTILRKIDADARAGHAWLDGKQIKSCKAAPSSMESLDIDGILELADGRLVHVSVKTGRAASPEELLEYRRHRHMTKPEAYAFAKNGIKSLELFTSEEAERRIEELLKKNEDNEDGDDDDDQEEK